MMNSSHSMMILLLRERSLEWVRHLPEQFPEEFVSSTGALNSFQEACQRFAADLRSLCHAITPWMLYRNASGDIHLGEQVISPYPPRSDHRWDLMPWGDEETALMFAFLCDDDLLSKILQSLHASHCQDLVVSVYTSQNIRESLFRGVIFERHADWKGTAIWEHAHEADGFAYVANTSGPLPQGVSCVAESQDSLGVCRWLQLTTAALIEKYARDYATILIVGGGLSPTLLSAELDGPVWCTGDMRQDALHFAVQALDSASWAYVPSVGRERREVFIHQDPGVTLSLLRDPRVAQVEFFKHVCVF